MKYYSALKNNEILPFGTTWITLQSIMLSEISQMEKDEFCIMTFRCGIKKKNHTYRNKE